jgi:hypothetical protein
MNLKKRGNSVTDFTTGFTEGDNTEQCKIIYWAQIDTITNRFAESEEIDRFQYNLAHKIFLWHTKLEIWSDENEKILTWDDCLCRYFSSKPELKLCQGIYVADGVTSVLIR